MAAIECDGTSAVVVFPTKTVKRICAWCQAELGEKEMCCTYDVDATHGICDTCALEQLPPHLHAEWRKVHPVAEVA